MDVRISQAGGKRLNALYIVVQLAKPVEQIPDLGLVVMIVLKAAKLPEEVDLIKNLNDVISHLFVLQDVLKHVASEPG